MSRLEKILFTLREMEAPESRDFLQQIDSRCKIIVTVLFIIAVLSVPLIDVDRLLWFFVVPIALSTMGGISYGRVFLSSLWVLPFVGLIGIFNPFIDCQPVSLGYGIVIARGWITFVSILVRGLLSMQAVIILLGSTGFIRICDGLRRLGVGRIITTQLMMVYRYAGVLVSEAIVMKQARQARGFGRDSFPLSVWGQLVGQLLLRTVDRADRIHRAMVSRGFDGTVRVQSRLSWQGRDTFFLVGSIAVLLLLYLFNFSTLFQ